MTLVQVIRVWLGPSFNISYTIPCLSEQFEPWASIIPAIIADIDEVNVMYDGLRLLLGCQYQQHRTGLHI